MGAGVDSDAYAAVQKGYIAVSIRWYLEGYGEGYGEAVANLKLRHPRCAGLGKWVWDAHRLVDYLCTLPEVDRERIGIIGHSTGWGRWRCTPQPSMTVSPPWFPMSRASGCRSHNYEDFWYFGEDDREAGQGHGSTRTARTIAVVLPFLLVGGDTYDTAKSWYYINAAPKGL